MPLRLQPRTRPDPHVSFPVQAERDTIVFSGAASGRVARRQRTSIVYGERAKTAAIGDLPRSHSFGGFGGSATRAQAPLEQESIGSRLRARAEKESAFRFRLNKKLGEERDDKERKDRETRGQKEAFDKEGAMKKATARVSRTRSMAILPAGDESPQELAVRLQESRISAGKASTSVGRQGKGKEGVYSTLGAPSWGCKGGREPGGGAGRRGESSPSRRRASAAPPSSSEEDEDEEAEILPEPDRRPMSRGAVRRTGATDFLEDARRELRARQQSLPPQAKEDDGTPTCNICWEELTPKSGVTTDCDGRHSFCRGCIGHWLCEWTPRPLPPLCRLWWCARYALYRVWGAGSGAGLCA